MKAGLGAGLPFALFFRRQNRKQWRPARKSRPWLRRFMLAFGFSHKSRKLGGSSCIPGEVRHGRWLIGRSAGRKCS